MLSIIRWLEEIEGNAADLYEAAAHHFAADPAFSSFLRQLAEEERWHRRLIESLGGTMGNEAFAEELISIDEETRANITHLLEAGRDRLAKGKMSRQAMLETMAAAEFSEWNEIFLYALHALKGNGREYGAAVAEIERHKEEIARFLAAEPDGRRYLEAVQRLPQVAGKRILIVEKHRALGRLLRSIVATVGEAEVVESGPEGLLRLERERFDVVVSDINMLAMSSLEFYARVIGSNPEMKDRFVFFTGVPLEESLDAADAGEAIVLAKPALISHLRRAVADIAHRSRIVH